MRFTAISKNGEQHVIFELFCQGEIGKTVLKFYLIKKCIFSKTADRRNICELGHAAELLAVFYYGAMGENFVERWI